MPAFVPDGPDVPERLLQAHEEGKVVFFCGAGISYPAGLPGFGKLVEDIYEEIGRTRSDVEETAFLQGRFDETIDLIERDLNDRHEDRLLVRRAVARILEPNLRRKGASDTHKGLLDLSQDPHGVTRLVTTNFDRIFEFVIKKFKLGTKSFLAPLLPIPKVTKWDGIVYLHGGLLSPKPSAVDLNRLVLSSGDFGLAYLNERWASRFVSELLKNFTVCFVGYSIEDPVLRYMMDALAADELLGENRIESFAFASFKTGQKESMERKWRAKGVEPLLFDQDAGGSPFAVLHKSIQEWARIYSTGTSGKRNIIQEHAEHPPVTPSRADFVSSRVLWALTDAKAAKHFAEMEPVPPIEWLDSLSESLFDATDLGRFGVKEELRKDDKRQFSMLWRPSPSTLAPAMSLVSGGNGTSSWDDVMWQLCRWLLRHLGDPKLILWIAERGGRIHHQFRWLIEGELRRLRKLAAEGKEDEISKIRENAPKAIPDAAMRILWALVLANRLKGDREIGVYGWFDRLAEEGLTLGLRMELRDLLRPCIAIAKPYRGLLSEARKDEEPSVESLVRWEIVLASEHPGSAIRDRRSTPNWLSSLPELLGDFQGLLQEALDLKLELSGSGEKRMLSVLDLPSISTHSQNRGYHEWTVLVSLTRDAWLATLEENHDKARNVARDWWAIEYPLFKRMALFAAAQEGAVEDSEAVGWLLSENGEWLWDIETKRECLRLLAELGDRWEVPAGSRRKPEQIKLEREILKGPPRENVKDDATEKDFADYRDRQIWLRLEKLSSGNYELGRAAASALRRLRETHASWKLAEDQSDEFVFWMEVSDGATDHIPTPTKPRDLVRWLKSYPKAEIMKDDDWRERCRTHPRAVIFALRFSFQQGDWYPDRLNIALYAWAEDEELLKQSWRYMADFLDALSDARKGEVISGLSWWMQAGGGIFCSNETVFFALANDLLDLGLTAKDQFDRDVMLDAINHPIGQATESVLRWWFRDSSRGKGPLEGNARDFLSKVCDTDVEKFRLGRVILARATAPLLRVDEGWATKFLLPLFDWQTSVEEAKVCWIGFLHSPRRVPALLSLLKGPFLATSNHLGVLGKDCREVYARFFTYVAIEPAGVFSDQEIRTVFDRFENSDLWNAARTLSDVIEGAGDKGEVFWRDTLKTFIKKIWPKGDDKKSGQIAGQFAEVCIAADQELPDAVATLKPHLREVQWPDTILDKLVEKNLHIRFPEAVLELVFLVVGEKPGYRLKSLKSILDQIGNERPRLRRRREFKRLQELLE